MFQLRRLKSEMTWKNDGEWEEINDTKKGYCGLFEDAIAESRWNKMKTTNNHVEDLASVSSRYFEHKRDALSTIRATGF